MNNSVTLKNTVTLIIPENLDADVIIAQNPFGFYGQVLKKEMLQFICSELLKSWAHSRKEMLEKDTPFTPLCAKYLQQLVYNYEAYLNFLLKQKVFLTDNHSIDSEKCRGYFFIAPYNGKRSKRIEVSGYILKKNLHKRALAWEQEQKKQLWATPSLQNGGKQASLKLMRMQPLSG